MRVKVGVHTYLCYGLWADLSWLTFFKNLKTWGHWLSGLYTIENQRTNFIFYAFRIYFHQSINDFNTFQGIENVLLGQK